MKQLQNMLHNEIHRTKRRMFKRTRKGICFSHKKPIFDLPLHDFLCRELLGNRQGDAGNQLQIFDKVFVYNE